MADVGETKADASSFGLATGVSAYVLICKLYNEPDHATGNKIRSMMTTRIRNGNVWKTKEGAQVIITPLPYVLFCECLLWWWYRRRSFGMHNSKTMRRHWQRQTPPLLLPTQMVHDDFSLLCHRWKIGELMSLHDNSCSRNSCRNVGISRGSLQNHR